MIVGDLQVDLQLEDVIAERDMFVQDVHVKELDILELKKDNNKLTIVRGSGLDVATPIWPSVGVKPNTSKVGDLESFGTPECLELDSKAQNTSHRGVLGVIGKS